jgi:hypothetical protein
MVDVFEPLNEIAHERAGRGSAGFLAEVRAAAEGTRIVDGALAVAQERAGTVGDRKRAARPRRPSLLRGSETASVRSAGSGSRLSG